MHYACTYCSQSWKRVAFLRPAWSNPFAHQADPTQFIMANIQSNPTRNIHGFETLKRSQDSCDKTV